MPYEEYDRLAWGYVKEELRHLLKPRPKDLGFEETLGQIIKPNRIGFYRDKGALSDKAHRLAHRTVLHQMRETLGAFNHTSFRARMEAGGGMMDVDSLYAWAYSDLGVRDVESQELSRRESFLELKHINIALGKRRMITDCMSCFVLINDHTLYRMVQRGAVPCKPLAYLTENLQSWFGYAAMFMLSHKYLGDNIGHNVFIPFADGALLGKMSFTETEHHPKGWSRNRLRFKDSILQGKIDSPPYDNILEDEFQGRQGSVTLQISTWIPMNYFHTEQWWAKYEAEEFAKQYDNVFDFCIDSIRGKPTITTTPAKILDVANMKSFGARLGQIFTDPRWATACQW